MKPASAARSIPPFWLPASRHQAYAKVDEMPIFERRRLSIVVEAQADAC